MPLSKPDLNHICDLSIQLDPIREMGTSRSGQRRIIPIIGGTVTGPKLNGRVQHLGADWQTVFEDGLAELDARYAMETDDGALIDILAYGLRHGPAEVLQALARGDAVDPATYYMRTHVRLRTGDRRYDWVNKTLFLGTGARCATGVEIKVYAIQ